MMRTLQLLASEAVLVFLVLYPALLLLDDLEPGFVRSVLNPHWFLLALIVAATVTGNTAPERVWSRRTTAAFGIGAAAVVGAWMWWRIGGGALGFVVAAVAAMAVGVMVWAGFLVEDSSE